MGWSLDLSPENIRFTMDEKRAQSVYECFKRLWEKGYIYRGKRLINWCVRCSTALSDIEVEHEQHAGKLWHLRYKGEDGSDGIVIATTRPETIFADAAIAVNPKDERYKNMVGKKVIIPLANRAIPIIADEAVELEFGTGALKITPAHDATDYEVGQRHNLPILTVINDKGKMINCPEKYIGMDRDACRKETVKDLDEAGLLVKEEKYNNAVSTCYRCHNTIEPFMSEQWFVKMDKLAAPAIAAAESGQLQFHPANWKAPFVNWLKNIQDWCISRQIWWGHRIPVWYCRHCSEKGLTFVTDQQGHEQLTKVSFEDGAQPIVSFHAPEKCPHCGGTDFVQDPDVLDTWFSSALWPMSVFGWPEETKELSYFYPTTSMVTGYEILYLWVARMVMMGLEFKGELPFKDVFLNGIVRDKSGQKMSKSKGNVIDPLDMTAKYGTDAVRFSLLMQAVPGKDIPYAEESITGARNFCNKIYNASRFILMNMEGIKGPLAMPTQAKELADQWILDRYTTAIKTAREGIEKYNLALTATTLYHFLWGDFCDWYIELAKQRFQTQEKEYVMALCVNILYGTLKALHPLIPFITEEIAASLRPYVNEKEEFLLQQSYPAFEPALLAPEAVQKMETIQGITKEIRTIRAQFNVPPGLKIKALISAQEEADLQTVREYTNYIELMSKVEQLQAGIGLAKPKQTATATFGKLAIYIPLTGLIDFAKEQKRLEKEIAAAQANIASRQARLSQENFIKHAPQAQIDKTKAELTAAQTALAQAQAALADLA
ncbi:MAG: valine--tRNA ligase [Elusimicrobiaceae bacterium]|nr:valine--tRNA ligase [Elusimicrobiaceae bacterium]